MKIKTIANSLINLFLYLLSYTLIEVQNIYHRNFFDYP